MTFTVSFYVIHLRVHSCLSYISLLVHYIEQLTFSLSSAVLPHPTLDTLAQPDERVHGNYRRNVNPVYTLITVFRGGSYIRKVSALFIQRLGEHADREEAIDLGVWLRM
jgi:hypothetical protein